MHTVPEILGLDKYGYDVGARMYARAEMRFSQDIAEDVSRQRLHDVPGADLHQALGSIQAQDTGESFVEAGGKGNAVILWNRTSHSTDGGKLQQRKRRQKLTADLLKEIVVSYGEPFKIVSSWFRVFEFYCDPPTDAALPPLPEAQDDAAALLDTSLARLSTSGASLLGRRQLDMAQKGDASVRRLSRPHLRQKPGAPPLPKAELDEVLWQKRCGELCKFKARSRDGRNICVGDLNLEKRCKVEHLDSDKLQNWMRAYEEATPDEATLVYIHEARVAAEHRRRMMSMVGSDLIGQSRVDTKVHKMEQHLARFLYDGNCVHSTDVGEVFTSKAFAKRSGNCVPAKALEETYLSEISEEDNASSAVDNGSSAVSTSATDENYCRVFRVGEDISSSELMLKTVSKTLLNSKLLQQAKKSKKDNKKLQTKNDEVMAERRRILRRVSPVQMTPQNLFQSLSMFGLARQRLCNRIYDFLSKCCPCLTQANSGDGLSFEAFLVLMRSLLGGKLKLPCSARPKSGTAGAHDRPNPLEVAAHINEHAWLASDLLMRLTFSLLTGRPASPQQHAAARREADQVGVPLSDRSLADSLRLFLSAPVLLQLDRGSISGGSEHLSTGESPIDGGASEEYVDDGFSVQNENSSPTGSKASIGHGAQGTRHAQEMNVLDMFSEHRSWPTEFATCVEFLHADLMQSQLEVAAMPDEDVNTCRPSALSFNAFGHWVSRAPDAYISLLHILFPLMPYGVALTSEELELAARGLSQRCGELRARSEVRAQGIQRKEFMKLFTRVRT